MRERFNEETPAVVIVVDRRPEMALYPTDLPWLHKPAALHEVARVLVASALNQRSLARVPRLRARTAAAEAGAPFWQPPRAQANVWREGSRDRLERYLDDAFDAPEDNVARALEFLGTVRSAVPIGSFVFVVSDFIAPPAAGAVGARGRPRLGRRPGDRAGPDLGAELPADRRRASSSLGDAHGAERAARAPVGAARSRSGAGSTRRGSQTLRRDFVRLGLDPVLVGDAAPERVHATLLEWANVRARRRPGSAVIGAPHPRASSLRQRSRVVALARAPARCRASRTRLVERRGRVVRASPRDRQREGDAAAVALRARC